MKKIYSLFTIVILACMLVTYSCKGDNVNTYNFTNNYIHDGKPDIMSFITDLKEAGCYENHTIEIDRFYQTKRYNLILDCPTEFEIPEKFTKILEKSKDPIQIAKVKDAIERAKKIHEEKKASFNKAYQLLMHGVEQFKGISKDSLCIREKDTVAIAITFDNTPKRFWKNNQTESIFGKMSNWVYGRKEAYYVYAIKGNTDKRIYFEYTSQLREDIDKIAFREPDTSLIEKTLLDHISTHKVSSVDVSYEYTSKVNPINNDSIFLLYNRHIRNGFYNCQKSVGKHFFIPLTENERNDFVTQLNKKLEKNILSHHYAKIWYTSNGDKDRDIISFRIIAQYYQGGMPQIPKDADMMFFNMYDNTNEAMDKLRHYVIYGCIFHGGLHILRLNSTQSISIPYNWDRIKKCVDFDYEYYDITKEGA